MDKFREAYNLPRVNHEETANLNRPRTSNKIESVIKKLPPHRSSDPDGFIGEFYQIFKELIPIPLQLFQNTRGSVSKLIYETSIIPIRKSDKDTIKRKRKKITGQ